MAWLMAGACDAGGERGEGVACRMGGTYDPQTQTQLYV